MTCKYLLQDHHEVLAAGLNLSPETLRMLYAWADQIVLLDARFLNRIPTQTKVLVCNVGPDRFEHHYNPELVRLLRGLLKTAGLLDSSPRVSISNTHSSR